MQNQQSNWQVYILLSSDQRLYTGITTDIRRRWKQHKNKSKNQCKAGAKFFSGRRPIALCFLEGEHDRKSASQREYQLKQLSRAEKWEWVLKHYGPFQNSDF